MFKLRMILVMLIFAALMIVPAPGFTSTYLIGTGIYDITGPAAECGMMGYFMPDQVTEGIHTRLRSRAFVVVDPRSGKRVALVIAEAGIIPQGINQAVVKKLLTKYNGLYTDQNVTISATHTHSGPGAYSHYALYNLSMFGYDEKHFNTVAEGIYQSIVRAHNNLRPGDIRINRGELNHCGWNRSSLAYEENPDEEKARYNSNTDKTMTLLRFVATDGSDLGTVNWFAVHPTSVGNTNKLISGDNKGYAAYLFEKQIGTNYAAADTFVAAFAISNAGDVSPNIYWGYPNGVDDYEHMKIIGECQYYKAIELFNEADVNLAGSVDYRHMYVDMSNQSISPAFMPPDHSGAGKTCVAAIGASVLAGSTEDGKGIDIPEGLTYPYDISVLGNPYKLAFTISPLDQQCQGKKPIVLPTGRIKFLGIPMTPEVLPVQILKIGNLAIIAMPTEITTMAGRRLQETVMNALGDQVDYVVIAALSNAYAEYVSTYEEYNVQHYEGASTHFGPYTLNAFQEKFDYIARAMKNGVSVSPGPTPRDISGSQLIKIPGVAFDDKPLSKSFGSVETDAAASYTRGQTVSVTFWGGHPKNNYQIQKTFLKVEKITPTGAVTVANDWDPETRYYWKRSGTANSKITIEWDTTDAVPGTYRIRHYGHWKSGWTGAITPYEGVSRTFTVH
ncbi:MAG: neutral/alkaline ceramidase [Smithella sp.]|nr:neutral/alkaline ceramidase [Smithella sp.]MDM7988738.1 neutral/alkaline non-lysosomal ceramidase N-terminal domain-containing protein [Smithella sp.]HQG66293.1 neutral/alkaline non-lysosomal ceramidase N-terminal domain-containing protein [Smithella sp.]HQI73388.1 neutral/alkaline non-lysosomal ceramidase N-terminal domain-containing protein [Smithella sp.]